jgi:hypothetical protein
MDNKILCKQKQSLKNFDLLELSTHKSHPIHISKRQHTHEKRTVNFS